MKKLLSILLPAALHINAYSQCTPNAPMGNAGIFPSPDSVPCIERGVFYDFTMQLENFDTLNNPFGYVITVDWTTIDSIENFPCGINWQASSPTFNTGQTACIRVSGTTNEAAGQYPLKIYLTMQLNVAGSGTQIVSGELEYLSSTAGIFGVIYDSRYVSRVINPGAPCPPRDTASNLIAGGSFVSITPSCAGSGIMLHATPGFAAYSWSTGEMASSIAVTSQGYYSVTVSDAFGCPGSNGHDLTAANLTPAEICIVGVDSATGKNVIVWEKPLSAAIDSYVIYRETNQTNVYAPIGTQAYGDFSTFIDVQSIPEQNSNSYKLGILDSCGLNIAGVNHHKTIHLSINQGVGNTWNLSWNHYEGFGFSTYNIYRGTSPGNLALLNSIASTLDSYTDLNPPAGVIYYQIEVENPNTCNPSAKRADSNYSRSRSNIVSTPFTGIHHLLSESLSLYPNPTAGIMTLKASGVRGTLLLRVDDALGQMLMRQTFAENEITQGVLLDLNEFSGNVFFLNIRNEEISGVMKVMRY